MANASKKINKAGTEPPQTTGSKFYCHKCGRAFGRLKGNFPISHSPLYRGGSNHLPWCTGCIDEMYASYVDKLNSPREAMRRVCMKLDLYWHPSLYDMVANANGSKTSYVRGYIGKTNLYKYLDKTFDDTLEEEDRKRMETLAFMPQLPTDTDGADFPEPTDGSGAPAKAVVTPQIVTFWGSGFPPEFYLELEQKYENWTHALGDIGPAERAIYRQICLLEATINKDSVAGRPIDKHVNALNSLLGSANLKPTQKKNEEADAELDNMPFGVGIRKWENTRPVPEPDPELEDPDKIVRYISIWFLGHLCKMLGIRNTYCKLYEEEIERLRVKNPEFEEDDDETLFDNIFGGDSA